MPIHRPPPPRAGAGDPALVRPDWTVVTTRPAGRLWLDKNENSDPEMARVVGTVVAGLDPSVFHSYPDLGGLYAKLADHVGLPPACLRLAPGSDGVIHSLFEAYVAPGDVVLHTTPTFAMYPVYCRMFGATAVPVAYEPSQAGPLLTAERLIDAIKAARPRLVCLPNPDSPTGSVFEPDELRAIVATAGDAGSLILIDEAYHPFHPDSAASWVERNPHLVVARSTGKAWGLAGFRIGYAIAHPDVAAILHKVRPMYEVGSVSAAVFAGMLDHADAMRASVSRLLAGKARFVATLERLGLRVLPTHGNFAHAAFGDHAAGVHRALEEFVAYRKNFTEPCLNGYSRFSMTTPELFQPVLDKIAAVVGQRER